MFNKGFSVIEALISLIIVSTFLITTMTFDAYAQRIVAHKITPIIPKKIELSSRFKGHDICFLNSSSKLSSIQTIDIPFVTSAVGRNGYVYITADSNVTSDPDLYIMKDGGILGAISTGPGLRDISIVKGFAYVANTSTRSQVQKIDITNPESPLVVASFAFASTGNAIYFDQDTIYVGAEKVNGPELVVLDLDLYKIKQYEIGSQVNDVLVTDKIYVAASDQNQLHILGESTFSPNGWETQQGKALAASGTAIYFGRTVGGFNNKENHELFLLGSTSTDIGAGVYGLVSTNDVLFVASRGIQIWKKPFTYISTIALQSDPISLSCDRNTLVVGTKKGIEIINFI